MISLTTLPSHIRDAITKEFDTEPVLFITQPKFQFAFKQSFAFGLPWLGFSLFLMFQVIQQIQNQIENIYTLENAFLILFLTPFVGVGLYMLALPFINARKAKHSYWILSQKRLCFFTHNGTQTITDNIPLDQSFSVRTFQDEQTGIGTLVLDFGTTIGMDNLQEFPYREIQTQKTQTIDGIKNAKQFEAALLQVVHRNRREK